MLAIGVRTLIGKECDLVIKMGMCGKILPKLTALNPQIQGFVSKQSLYTIYATPEMVFFYLEEINPHFLLNQQ